MALALHKDYSGIPVLQAMTVDPGMFKKALDLAVGSQRLDPDSVKCLPGGGDDRRAGLDPPDDGDDLG